MARLENEVEPQVVSRLFYTFRDMALTMFKHTHGDYKGLSEQSLQPFRQLARSILADSESFTASELTDLYGVYSQLDIHFDGFSSVQLALKRQIEKADPEEL